MVRCSDVVQEKFPEVRKGQSRDKAGAILGVSGRYITTAEKLLENAPELAKQVRAGEISLNQAIREYNRQQGHTKEPSSVERTRTMVRRLSTTFKKVRPSNALPRVQYDEVKQLLERLTELLEPEEESEE